MSRIYEQERLRLYVQEAIAEAIEKSGHAQDVIAQLAGLDARQVRHALCDGAHLDIDSAAALAHAAGYRIVVALEKLEGK